MMVQAPDTSLFRQMRMRRMRGEQLVQRRSGCIDIAIAQLSEHATDTPRKCNERRDMCLSQLRYGRRIHGQDAGEGRNSLARRWRDVTLVVRVQLVDERLRHEQAGIFVTI